MGVMSDRGLLRTFEGVPDHGFGAIGRLARGVLDEYVKAPPPEPRLHLGHNTLPDPPFPLSAHIPYTVVEGAWRRSGGDLAAFLASAARSLRAQPKVPASAYSEQHRMLNRLLRVDSIALACEAYTLLPTESVEGWMLAADLMAGRSGRAELHESEAAERALVVWAVDRSGKTLLMNTPVRDMAGDAADDVSFGDVSCLDALDRTDPIVARLMEILDAQYEWITAVFGTDSQPGFPHVPSSRPDGR